ncbi:MAG: YaiI/YqxD family protein [Planctomycetota bacterium]|jgi:uncharacterized protein YaiI (UPF0178 family)
MNTTEGPGKSSAPFTLWLDADACPKEARKVLFRAILRLEIPTVVVANAPLRTPNYDFFTTVLVTDLADAADDHIAENVNSGDLVITGDVPLASRAVKAGATALSPRGRVFDENSAPSRLATRNLLADLRERGVVSGGPPPYTEKDKRLFASALDRLLTRLAKG